jgi:hypothetical protein
MGERTSVLQTAQPRRFQPPVTSTAAPIFQQPRLIGVAYSSTGGGSDETENRAVGICGIDCRGLLGASWLGDSTLNGTRLVEPRSIDLSDCACWVPFSLRCQVVLGTSHERSRICANRSDNGRSAAIAVSVARARAIVVAKSPLPNYPWEFSVSANACSS